jgi:hypothetical protein
MKQYKKYRVVSESEDNGAPVYFIEGCNWFGWKRWSQGGWFELDKAVAKCDSLNHTTTVIKQVVYPINGEKNGN